MSALPHKKTDYAEYVFSNLRQQLAGGEGTYNVKELAEKVGLKPTGNFRRRIKQMVADGNLISFACFTHRGGVEAQYYLPVENDPKYELPF